MNPPSLCGAHKLINDWCFRSGIGGAVIGELAGKFSFLSIVAICRNGVCSQEVSEQEPVVPMGGGGGY